MDLSPDLLRGTVTPVILSLLTERAMYGYELAKTVNARTNGVLEWKEGTLYPALHRLEIEGLVKGQWREVENADRGPGRRKYYALTRAGAKEAARRKGEWATFSNAVGTLMKGV